MSAGDYTMKICQGSDYRLLLTITDDNQDPIDLTGHVFSGQMRKGVSLPDIIASFSFNILDQNVAENLGKVEVLLSNTVSSAIELDEDNSTKRKSTKFIYDIESAATETKRWLQGTVEMSPEVTR